MLSKPAWNKTAGRSQGEAAQRRRSKGSRSVTQTRERGCLTNILDIGKGRGKAGGDDVS